MARRDRKKREGFALGSREPWRPRRPGRRRTGAAGPRRGLAHERKPDGLEERHEPEPPSTGSFVRLNRFLAQNGIASRRHADQLIAAGKVMVDGEIVTALGTQIEPARQRVEVDGIVLRAGGERHRYYLLNKPAGVVCTNDLRENRPRAIDLVTDPRKGRIYTVGRLDEETVGLVLLTNDGDFANLLTHPRYGVEKTYRVEVYGSVDEETVARLRRGVRLSEGWANFSQVKRLKRGDKQSVLLLSLREGKNREIRRVLARVGLAVGRLRRVRIGPITDRGLKVGRWRVLAREEVELLSERAARGESEGGVRRAGDPGRPERRRRDRPTRPELPPPGRDALPED
jgi:23S rRNA pseudouridine2605 synthase